MNIYKDKSQKHHLGNKFADFFQLLKKSNYGRKVIIKHLTR